jgi:hypothetical protein
MQWRLLLSSRPSSVTEQRQTDRTHIRWHRLFPAPGSRTVVPAQGYLPITAKVRVSKLGVIPDGSVSDSFRDHMLTLSKLIRNLLPVVSVEPLGHPINGNAFVLAPFLPARKM